MAHLSFGSVTKRHHRTESLLSFKRDLSCCHHHHPNSLCYQLAGVVSLTSRIQSLKKEEIERCCVTEENYGVGGRWAFRKPHKAGSGIHSYCSDALVVCKESDLGLHLSPGFQCPKSQDSSHTRSTMSDSQGLSCGSGTWLEGLFSFVGRN